MSTLPLLDTRAGFTLAALVVTFVSIALIGVVVANLHTRLLRLEQASPATRRADPYVRLSGTPIDDLLPAETGATTPRAVVVMSTGCRACERVLDELRQRSPPFQIVLIWNDRVPPSLAPMPANVSSRQGDAQLRARLGTGVTPFALVIGDDGVVMKAFPMSGLDLLIQAMHGSRQPFASAHTAAL
jgi:hypothetical protein